MSKVLGTARNDIAQQLIVDERHPSPQAAMLARMRAVVTAQHRVTQREPDAGYELRQSLVDLAAIAESIAAELPAPRR